MTTTRQANLLHTLRSNMSHAEFLYLEAAKAGAGRVELDRLWNDYQDASRLVDRADDGEDLSLLDCATEDHQHWEDINGVCN
jgi:hypothetical protein